MSCPIDKATLNSISKAIATLQELARQIELANQAGVDVAESAARCEHLTQLSKQLVQAYGPMIFGPQNGGNQ